MFSHFHPKAEKLTDRQQCPIPGCKLTHADWQIMCTVCWRTVSAKTRGRVWSSRRYKGPTAQRNREAAEAAAIAEASASR